MPIALPQKNIPPNTVRAHIVPGANIDPKDYIRTAVVTRDWMDAVPQRYIYRCIPLLAANTMGWELMNPVESTIRWNGGTDISDLNIHNAAQNRFAASSHFGNGVITWYVPFLFKTSPELGLIVTGPANHEKASVTPLDAFVRTDWLPFPFTMNWRVTHKDTPVTFKAGEPIARILPFPLQMLDETTLEITDLVSDPGFLDAVNQFGQARQDNVARQHDNAKTAQESGEAISADGVWNAQYVKARGPRTTAAMPHQTVFNCKRPEDKR